MWYIMSRSFSVAMQFSPIGSDLVIDDPVPCQVEFHKPCQQVFPLFAFGRKTDVSVMDAQRLW
jgi:hypothetical protein